MSVPPKNLSSFLWCLRLLSATSVHHLGLASGARTEMLGIGIMALSNWMLQAILNLCSLPGSVLGMDPCARDGPMCSAPPSRLRCFTGKQTWVRAEEGATGME